MRHPRDVWRSTVCPVDEIWAHGWRKPQRKGDLESRLSEADMLLIIIVLLWAIFGGRL